MDRLGLRTRWQTSGTKGFEQVTRWSVVVQRGTRYLTLNALESYLHVFCHIIGKYPINPLKYKSTFLRLHPRRCLSLARRGDSVH